MQEKLKNIFFHHLSNDQNLLTNKTIGDISILQKIPKLIVSFCTTKRNSKEFLHILKNSNLYEEKYKSRLKPPKEIKILTLRELICKYSKQNSTCLSLRKILKNRLKNYENIGFDNRDLWFVASDAKYFMDQNPNYFKVLKENLNKYSNFFSHIIELDLKRTLPSNPDEELIATLNKCRIILNAYARRNPDLGYCQGLNFIAWEICRRNFSEEESFWFFVSLIENILPLDYYSSLEGVLVDQRIFTYLIEIKLPAISKKLKECNLDCSAFSIPWFVCIFSRTLNNRLFEIVLDNLIVQGSIALFKIGLSLLKMMEEQILKAKDFPQLLKIIEEKSKKYNDPLKFQEFINQIYLSKKVINMARLLFSNIIDEENFRNNAKHNKFNQRNMRNNFEKYKESKTKCNVNDFTCLAFIEFNKICKKNYIFFTFKQNPKLLNIIDDYIPESFEVDPKKQTKNGENNKNNIHNHKDLKLKKTKYNGSNNGDSVNNNFEEKILIGRHTHICKKTLENGEKDILKKEKANLIPHPNDSNILQNYIVQTVKDTRESNLNSLMPPMPFRQSTKPLSKSSIVCAENRSKNHSNAISPKSYATNCGDSFGKYVGKNNSPMSNNIISSYDNEYAQDISFNFDQRLSDMSAYVSPSIQKEKKNNFRIIPKTSIQSEHSVIFLGEADSIKSNRSDENIDDIYEDLDPDNINPRESILILKNKRIYNNINKEVLDKYYGDIEHSESFDFVNKFFAQEIIKNEKVLF